MKFKKIVQKYGRIEPTSARQFEDLLFAQFPTRPEKRSQVKEKSVRKIDVWILCRAVGVSRVCLPSAKVEGGCGFFRRGHCQKAARKLWRRGKGGTSCERVTLDEEK